MNSIYPLLPFYRVNHFQCYLNPFFRSRFPRIFHSHQNFPGKTHTRNFRMKILSNFIAFKRGNAHQDKNFIKNIPFFKLFQPQVKSFRFKNKISLKKLGTSIDFFLIFKCL